MTINQKYYAMNSALIAGLANLSVVCPVYKYGTVPQPTKYPYIQTSFRVKNRQPFGSATSGTLVTFEFYLNFFTAAGNEKSNDAALFIPYETARELITTPQTLIWSGIANVRDHEETPEFNFKGGLEVLMRGLIFDCQTVVSHVIADAGKKTTIDNSVDVANTSLTY